MGTTKLAKSDWHSYFDRLAKSLRASEVAIEVANAGNKHIAKITPRLMIVGGSTN